MRFSHQPLSANAVLGFGTVTAPASSGSTLIEPNGKPTIAASNLWLANGDEGDAEKFASSVVIQITPVRSEEHTSELQSLMRISYAVFCLKKKTKHNH